MERTKADRREVSSEKKYWGFGPALSEEANRLLDGKNNCEA